MMNETQSITEGIREMLFGKFRPAVVLHRYKNGDRDLCHTLLEIPHSPLEYLQCSEIINRRWKDHLDEKIAEEWIAPHYSIPKENPEPFHILCSFYRSLIFCECRMLVQVAESYLNRLEMTLLKFELVTLRDRLVEYLKECRYRISGNHHLSETTQYRFYQYLTERLFINLLMIILELQIRYAHIFKDRIISREALFLKYLEWPVPVADRFYRTQALTIFDLKKLLQPTADIRTIEALLQKVRKEYNKYNHDKPKAELQKSVYILENTWLCAFIRVEHGNDSIAEMAGAEENRQRINRWREMVKGRDTDTGTDLEQSDIRMILKFIPEIKEGLNSGQPGGKSEAVNLVLEIENLFDPSAGSGGIPEEMSNRIGLKESPENHWLLDQYISLDLIVKKMGVTMKSMRTYLRESGAEIIEMTAKNRWMHVDDFTAFMDQHRTKM